MKMNRPEDVVSDIKGEWAIEDIFIIRRMGQIAVGEIILAAAVSAKNRHDAFEACAGTIDRLKKLKTIKKREVFI